MGETDLQRPALPTAIPGRGRGPGIGFHPFVHAPGHRPGADRFHQRRPGTACRRGGGAGRAVQRVLSGWNRTRPAGAGSKRSPTAVTRRRWPSSPSPPAPAGPGCARALVSADAAACATACASSPWPTSDSGTVHRLSRQLRPGSPSSATCPTTSPLTTMAQSPCGRAPPVRDRRPPLSRPADLLPRLRFPPGPPPARRRHPAAQAQRPSHPGQHLQATQASIPPQPADPGRRTPAPRARSSPSRASTAITWPTDAACEPAMARLSAPTSRSRSWPPTWPRPGLAEVDAAAASLLATSPSGGAAAAHPGAASRRATARATAARDHAADRRSPPAARRRGSPPSS